MFEEIKKIISIFNNKNINNYRDKIEIKKLIDLYVKFDQDEDIYELINNENLLKYRKNNEQISLIKKYFFSKRLILQNAKTELRDRVNLYMGKDNFDKYILDRYSKIFDIISNKNILELRTYEEQIMLIDEFMNVDDLILEGANLSLLNNISYDIIINSNILKKCDNEEHLNFIKNYSILSNEIVEKEMKEILNNKLLFENRNIEEIKKMIELYLSTENKYISKFIQNSNLVKFEKARIQIRLLESIRDSLIKENIKEINDLRKLVEELKKELSLSEENSKCKK